jgi:hypothetical protein
MLELLEGRFESIRKVEGRVVGKKKKQNWGR